MRGFPEPHISCTISLSGICKLLLKPNSVRKMGVDFLIAPFIRSWSLYAVEIYIGPYAMFVSESTNTNRKNQYQLNCLIQVCMQK